MKADIVIFDPLKINDKATFINPHQYLVGISYVFINGHLALDKGVFLGTKNGQVLRKHKL
ncbi:MAG: hypothetical protein L7T62_00700 [Flavobacteriaceae bacterium]|nr:hypothetical protein [Flavobacteriaceae bacterium]